MSSIGKNNKPLKIKLDQHLVTLGLAADLKEAAGLIMSGKVLVDNKPVDKAAAVIKSSSEIRVKGKESKWASRAGLKLEGAIKHFNLDVKDKVCVDLGASTGGFTDVLLTNGAKKVYAVDVGYGQLAWKLQSNNKVIVLDRTNARNLDKSLIPEALEVIVCDASFISLKTILPASMALSAKRCIIAALIKPQFEAKKHEVEEGGFITSPEVHARICSEIELWIKERGWNILGITESPIKGMEGNKEFLIAAVNYDLQ